MTTPRIASIRTPGRRANARCGDNRRTLHCAAGFDEAGLTRAMRRRTINSDRPF